MAKKRIQNYIFLPGTASGSNAYPNAYALLSTNKQFIIKESSEFIANSITADTLQNLYPFAVTLLTNNKTFLKDEITAWIAAQVAGSIAPFVGFTYDSDKCKRDVGYVIDAYIYDLRYGGNEQTIEVSKQYWLSGVAQIDGDRAPEVAAHNKLAQIINSNILTRTLYSSQQSPVTSTQNVAGTSGEAGTAARITTLSGILVNVIANGQSVLPAYSYSVYSFAGYVYDTSKCERDVGYVIDGYLNDLRYGGNIETRFVASRYWEGQSPQIDGDRQPEVKTHQWIRDLLNNYIFPQDEYTPLQAVVLPVAGTVGEAGASTRITALTLLLTNVISNGLTSLPAKSNGVTQLQVQGKINLEELLLITNTTTNQVMYNFSSNVNGASIDYFDTYNSNGRYSNDSFPSYLQIADYVTTITLDIDTSSCLATDDIQIFVEKTETTIRPWDFGTDAIERMRVATPQSMLDADFEYGLQPTKWQAIGLLRGYPSVYEIPGTDTEVLTVTTDASVGTASIGASLITVTTSSPHGFTVGTPITIKALANSITGFSRAEGTFLVNTVPSTSSFTYYSASKVGTSNGQVLSTTYTQLRKAAFYTGASIGSPAFSIFSQGTSGTLSTRYITTSGTDQIAFTGTAPEIGAPLTGTGINPGTQVTGIVGSGGIVVSTSIDEPASIGDTSIVVADSTGILEGLAITNGTGTAIFVNSVVGNTVSLTGELTADLEGNNVVYYGITGSNVSSTGIGATFDFQRLNQAYDFTSVSNIGTGYKQGDQIRILGTDLEGTSPTNDIVITVVSVESGGGIDAISWTGTSVNGNVTYTALLQDSTTGSGINSTFTVIRSDTGDSTSGTYLTTLVNGGSDFNIGDQITILGSRLGGAAPANNLVITVTGVDGLGVIETFTASGNALGTEAVFADLSGSNIGPFGAGAVFNVFKNLGVYSLSVIDGGEGYLTGNQILIYGTSLGGTSPANDLLVTITNAGGGSIVSIDSEGTGTIGGTVDFYSAITLSEVTTSSIANNTSVTFSAIANILVTFGSAHGLVPGSSITVSVNSNGPNHGLAAGPFFVENVPSLTTLRYTARTAGVINVSTTALTGTIYTRSDTYFIHRPYDGGVQLGTGGPQHGAQAIRMSKKYIRYQSGKGIMYTTGALFAPSYDLQSLTATDTEVGAFITVVTDDVDHGCQVGGVIEIKGVDTAGYNGTYTVSDVINERQFRIQAQTVLGNVYATLSGQAQMSLVNWHGATVRAGAFDDQNGMFWQYDGTNLSVGRRTSTFQLAGTVSAAVDSNIITGTNTRFRDQLHAGDKVVIKGMTHTVSNITSQTSMTVTPDYRGAVAAVSSKLCKVEDIIITQENFNIDRLDGEGPSGYNVNPSTMQMIGIQYSWYGAGFIDWMLRGSDGNYIFVHRIRNSNVNTEAYMRTGNLPVRYEVINESAKDKLFSSITATQTTIPLTNATDFPNESGVVLIDNEMIAFTGKSANTLTGCTRSAPMTSFVAGAQRTFRAGTAATHEFNTGVVLVSNTVSPIISHWGSAILTDGMFDDDRGYIFSYAATNVAISTSKKTAFLIRLAPSVSNAIVGDLGARELLNRAQLLLKGIEITSDTGTGGIVIEGVINPQNYPVNPVDIGWGGLQGSAQGGQPSFSQIAPGGSVVWSSGGSTSATVTTQAFPTGSITARALSWRSNRSVENGSNFIAITRADYNTYIAAGLAVGDSLSGSNIASNTTINQIFFWYTDGTLGDLFYIGLSINSTGNTTGDTTLTVTKRYNTASTSIIFFQSASWVSGGASTGTEVATGGIFAAGAFVSRVESLSYFGTAYYRVFFNQSTISAITPGTTTVVFTIGAAQYAKPGETVFSFVASPGVTASLELGELKELTNTTLGGRGTYPNGPDVLAINVYKVSGSDVNSNIVLRWSEAQA